MTLSDVTGRDLTLESQGDLIVRSADGLLVDGEQLIVEALLRRLSTPYGGYTRLVREASGLIEVNAEYGNKAYDYLSAPVTPANIASIEQYTLEAAQQETRIQVLAIKAQISSDYLNIVDVVLQYRILSQSEILTLNLQIPNV